MIGSQGGRVPGGYNPRVIGSQGVMERVTRTQGWHCPGLLGCSRILGVSGDKDP